MNHALTTLEPQEVWKHFTAINAIPRASKKEQAIADFMVAFGKKLGLETIQDAALNVLIKKPATLGFENRKKVTLQSHLDMVHQKNNDTVFDFATQGIQMFVEDDWVKANGTTLGADNGMGVASIMAILASNILAHPELEALFTVDEETGMTGAFELQPNFISGDILLNLDTEDDDEITIGCAGGIDVTAEKTHALIPILSNSNFHKIVVNGLQGGHSGIEIHKGLGNSNKILNRVLYELNQMTDFQIISITGGNLRNAIPREAESTIATKDVDFTAKLNNIASKIVTEWHAKESKLSIQAETVHDVLYDNAISKEEQHQLLNVIYTCFNGVYTFDAHITDLVATSNNLASVTLHNGKTTIACLTRSSIESEKQDVVNLLTATFHLANFKVTTSGAYPGWQPNTKSSILNTMTLIYERLFHEKPHVNACHAGLECGIIGKPYPNMEMISFGPTIRGAHSPDEKVSISSTQKFWHFLTEILKNIPKK